MTAGVRSQDRGVIEQAFRDRGQKPILLPVGKLTNIALALLKEPAIAAARRPWCPPQTLVSS
jgi:inosine-uridine nucleoside N-ribohydrolase